MDITRDQQIALDDALVAPSNRLKIGKSNLRLSSDLNSKEATLQVVYDVLKLTPFYKAFQITMDVPEIYMQEFWATATIHHHSTHFKMNNKKHIEILMFLKDLGHSGEIKMITNVNVNKLHQPWRSFAAEEFVYQVENKNVKRSNEMYYPSFTKQAGSDKTKTPPTAKGKRLKTSAKAAKPAKKKQRAKMSKAKGTDEGTGDKPGVPDVPTYVSDDEQISWKSIDEEDDDEVPMSGDDDDDADNQDDDDNDDDDQTDDNTDNENDDNKDDDDGQDHEQTDSDNDGHDFIHPKFSTHDEEDKEEDSFDPRVQTHSHFESTNDEDSDEEIQGVNVKGEEVDEEETHKEDEENELYRDVNVNLEGRDTEMTDAPHTIIQTTQVIEDTHVIITPVNPEGQQQSFSVSSGFVSNMLNSSQDTCIDYIFNFNTESTSLVDVPVTTIAEPPFLSATILPPLPTTLITHL
ncbi:hypothetical protein Tco_1199778 [Tanacetum coccineum]